MRPSVSQIEKYCCRTCLILSHTFYRKQRNGLVQTEEQYSFIHDALVEAIEAGETHITKSCLPKYIHSLQCIDVTDEKPNPCKVLEKQYKVGRRSEI